uniref:Mot1 central domain-containing protein n=1 Tax=Meloidogyne javanica TaxID=6303 RepID=A0A915N658_MELJA
MSDSRLSKLRELLESRNRILRSEAISMLTQYAPISCQQAIYSWDQLFDIVTQCFRSSLWECRVASAELLAALLLSADNAFYEKFEFLSKEKMKEYFNECATLIENLDLNKIISNYKMLVGFEEENDTSVDKNNSTDIKHKKKQRQLIDLHLDMNSATGVSSSTFITDDEIATKDTNFTATDSPIVSRRELYEEVINNECPFVDTFSHNFLKFGQQKIKDEPSLDDLSFTNISTINEQESSLPLQFLKSFYEFFYSTLLRDLVSPKWQTRHGACLVLTKICNYANKWLFPFSSLLTKSTTRLLQLFCLDRFCDFVTGSNVVAPVREIISAGSQAICSFFLAANSGIAKFNANILSQIRQETLPRIWGILQHPERLTQLREGVDSVLVDLLGLLEFWLSTDKEKNQSPSQSLAQLSDSQVTLLVELLECSPQTCPTERNIKVMQCLCSIFKNDSLTITPDGKHIWTEKLLFQTLKRLYRCVIFCPPSSTEILLPSCHTTLSLLLELFQRHMALTSNFNNLLGNDLSLNIDVFLHNVDGFDSRRDFPKELMCGEELHFLERKQMDLVILERKAMAARWLAPLVDTLFRWGCPIGQQPMFISVQLLFFPYLRSNSLYQKLGSALLAQEWSNVYQNSRHIGNFASDNQSIPAPDILIKELYEQLSYQADDLRALSARYALIVELIEDTKLATRTYSSRINALFSSALINFMEQLPLQLTPLIKPLMDTIESENSSQIANCHLVNAFSTLIERTSSRKPCPHSKILRQLMLGLGQCDQWSPKALKWNEQSLLHNIISVEQSESSVGDRPLAIKARNCVKVLKFICAKFGSKIVEICPEMVNGHLWDMIKENDDGEEFLLLLDYFGVIFLAITDKQIRLSLIKERIGPKIPHIMALLVNTNPAIRFRVSRFLSNLTEIELCPMLRLFFQPLSEMISDNASTSAEWAMLGASELLL